MDTNKTCYLFFDFDGTLTTVKALTLQDGRTEYRPILPDRHIDSLKKAHSAGHKLFLCTGRSRGSLYNMGEEFMKVFSIPWDGMIFGASDMWYSGERISVTYIPKDECILWLDYCRNTKKAFCYNGVERPIRYDFSGELTDDEVADIYSDFEKQYIENPITNFSTIPIADNFDMSKTELTVVNLATYTDVFSAGCNKGSAIARYCELISVPMEQTICFGDSENDIDMFKVCSASVAMKKAPDSLKTLATYSAESDFGVMEAISHIFGI